MCYDANGSEDRAARWWHACHPERPGASLQMAGVIHCHPARLLGASHLNRIQPLQRRMFSTVLVAVVSGVFGWGVARPVSH